MQIRQYAIYTRDPQFASCMGWVSQHGLRFEVHLNRTRFYLDEGALLTEFLLRWGSTAELIESLSE